MARGALLGVELIPERGVLQGGRLGGWTYLFLRFEFDGPELLLLAKCCAPNWPFPHDIPLDHTLFRRLRPALGDRPRWLKTDEFIAAAYSGEKREPPAWLAAQSGTQRMTVRAVMQRVARHGRPAP